MQRNYILVGTPEDNALLRAKLLSAPLSRVRISAEFDLNSAPISDLISHLHLHSANGVILNAQHSLFGLVEKAIQICELEGVEAWLLADFFKTQISHTLVDDLLGRPVLIFRTTPDSAFQNPNYSECQKCFPK